MGVRPGHDVQVGAAGGAEVGGQEAFAREVAVLGVVAGDVVGVRMVEQDRLGGGGGFGHEWLR